MRRRRVELKETLDATPIVGPRERPDRNQGRLHGAGGGNLPMNFAAWVELVEFLKEDRDITKGWELSITWLGGWTLKLRVDWNSPHEGARKRIAVKEQGSTKYTIIYDSQEQE